MEKLNTVLFVLVRVVRRCGDGVSIEFGHCASRVGCLVGGEPFAGGFVF